MVTEQEELSLAYLLDPAFQLINTNGKPLTGGWIECYIHGTRNKYYCYSDWNGNLHPFQIPLDSLGANIVLAEPSQSYDIYVYNKFGSLVMSRYNVMPGKGGSGSAVSLMDSQHWLGQDGPLAENLDPAIEYNILPLPTTPDYQGAFIERIENGNCMYLTAGIYLINCVIDYKQDPTALQNTLDEVKVFTGNANGDEDQAFILDETGPDSSTDRHCLKLTFIRKVLSQGETSTVDCSNVLFFAPSNDVKWKNAKIQTLQIVKLQMPHGAIGTGDYTAGQYVQITDTNVINVTGLQPAGNYATEEYVQQAVSGLENYTEGQYISIQDHVISVTGLEPGSGAVYQEGQYISIDGDTISVTGVQPAGDYVTEDQLNSATSGKLDSSAYVAPVNADWNSTSGLSEILNKPSTEEVQFEELDLSSYATHDEVTSATSGKLDTSAYHEYNEGQYVSIDDYTISVTGLQPAGEYATVADLSGKLDSSAYVAPVNSDWNATSGLSQILNKPSTEEVQFEELDLSSYATKDYVDSATSGIVQYTEGNHIQITDQNQINVTGIGTLSAGPNVEIYEVGGGYAISAAPGGSSYSEGQYISIDNNEISVTGLQPVSAMSAYVQNSGYVAPVQSDWDEDDNTDLAYILNKPDPIDLIPGSGISITDTSAGVVISCSATCGGSTYTEGQYISIDNNVISVTGLQPSGDYVERSDLSAYVAKNENSVKIGSDNNVSYNDFAQGTNNRCSYNSLAQGQSNSALNYAFAQGVGNSAASYSFAQGYNNSGYGDSLMQGENNKANAQSIAQGQYNSANNYSIAQGYYNSAYGQSLAQGQNNSASTYSIAQGSYNYANFESEALGYNNKANQESFAQGAFNSAFNYSMAQGHQNYATGGSMAQGYANSAFDYSQAFGINTIISESGMAIGRYNETSAGVAFVIGNGTYQSPSDLYWIDNSGNVHSPSGYFYDKDGKVGGGGGTTYSEGQYISIDNDTISVTGLDPFEYAVSGISGVSGVFIEDAGDHMNIGLSAQFATLEDIASSTSGKLDSSAYTAPVNSDWNATSGLAEILNKPSTESVSFEELDLSTYVEQNDLSAYQPTSAMSAYQTVANMSGYAQLTDLASYQPTSGMASYATDNEVAAAVSGKQNKITAFNDSVLVNALPASPVATTLYLIPEA